MEILLDKLRFWFSLGVLLFFEFLGYYVLHLLWKNGKHQFLKSLIRALDFRG